jgi:DNA-binding winged helix-turn-helix (wHTH) protein
VVRFGLFEIDLDTGELRRRGARIPLQQQPFQVLAMLLERPGRLVTRDQLRARIWPDAVYVDFDHGLNKAVSKLRRALGDTADNPRYVETLSRRGYRFVAPVDGAPAAAPASTLRLIWEGRAIAVAEGSSDIGRDRDAAICVDAPSVSRRHARVVFSEGRAMIEDMHSKNGTFVNGRRIEGPVALSDGDEIRVGVALLVVRAWADGSTATGSA